MRSAAIGTILRRGDRRLHAGEQTLGQARAGFRRAVVVLARRDVAGASGEVDLEDAFLLLQPLPGHADEVVARAAVAIVALRMRGVVVQPDDRPLAPGEGDRLQKRVDEPFRRGLEFRVGGGAESRADLAVGQGNSPRGGHPLDLGLARADPVDGLEIRQRVADRLAQPVAGLGDEARIGGLGRVLLRRAASQPSPSKTGAVCWWTHWTMTRPTSVPAASASCFRSGKCVEPASTHQSIATST